MGLAVRLQGSVARPAPVCADAHGKLYSQNAAANDEWYAGTLHGFDYSAGKCGDALKDLLPADIWNGYLETFAACTEEDIWRALFKAGELFTELTKRTAKVLGFTVTDEYDRRVTSFLKYTKDLPRNAKTLDFHID